MWNKLRSYIGQHFTFRLNGMLMSGFFCGIGEVNGNYGMVFIDADCAGKEMGSCILIHPLQIKCTLYSDVLNLRRTCRKIFRKFKLTNHSEDIYYPAFEINEMASEKRVETRR